METITKEKIADLLKDKLGLSTVLRKEITSSIFSEIARISLSEESLLLTNFGKFQVHHKRARPGRNFHTKESSEVKERKVLKFHPSNLLKEQVKSHES